MNPGSLERPLKTIGAAAQKLGPGDLLVIHSGIYREQVVIKASGTAAAPIRIENAAGEDVVITGADVMVGWEPDSITSSSYHVEWPHRFNTWSKTMAHPGDERHLLIGRCEQVMIDGYLLRQVLDSTQLAPGTFFADVTNKLLHVWDIGSRDLKKVTVEASVRTEVIRVEGDYVQLRGLQFRYAANAAQHGPVALRGRFDVMEDCVSERMNASGAVFAAEDVTVRRCVFRDNGQLGFGANGAHRLLLTDCLVENNNTKDFSRGWEAGGDKLVLCRDAVLENSRFVRNRGCGVWFDIGNENCIVRNCLIADNEDAGIFYEISFGLQAHDNVIVGNGFATTAGAWGAQAGICLSSSPDGVIERNILLGNREGFNFREQTRTTPRIGRRGAEVPVWNHDEIIRNNIVALNRDAQVWGWFDMKDNRHWPRGEGRTGRGTEARPGDMAAEYTAKSSEGQPRNLTLEALKLRFENNRYYAVPGQGWFAWGPTWTWHQKYGSLQEFQSALHIDMGSKAANPEFADIRSLDLRLSSAAMLEFRESYPRGNVPGVKTGTR